MQELVHDRYVTKAEWSFIRLNGTHAYAQIKTSKVVEPTGKIRQNDVWSIAMGYFLLKTCFLAWQQVR